MKYFSLYQFRVPTLSQGFSSKGSKGFYDWTLGARTMLLWAALMTPSLSVAQSDTLMFLPGTPIPIGTAAWVYDEALLETDIGDGLFWNAEEGKFYARPITHDSQFASRIIAFNSKATPARSLTHIYTYATTPETSCRLTETNEVSGCSADNEDSWKNEHQIVMTYDPDSLMRATNAYQEKFERSKASMHVSVSAIPTVDGRLDQVAYGLADYLDAMNYFNDDQARFLAKETALAFCPYDVPSIHFDIEPFDFTKPGQKAYYSHLADFLAGKHDPISDQDGGLVSCRTDEFPHGRSWSVFTFPKAVNADFAETMNRHRNGYVIFSAYDLEPKGGKPAGVINSLEEYKQLLNRLAIDILRVSEEFDIIYKVAIPIISSVHEFETILGRDKHGVMQADNDFSDGKYRADFPAKVADYMQLAIRATESTYSEKSILKDENFVGFDYWGFASRLRWPRDRLNGGTEFLPSYPQTEILDYLAAQIPVPASVEQRFLKVNAGELPKIDEEVLLTINNIDTGDRNLSSESSVMLSADVLASEYIEKVEFWSGEQLLASVDRVPYSTMHRFGEGIHDVSAKVFFETGEIIESAPVSLDVKRYFRIASFAGRVFDIGPPYYETGGDKEYDGISQSVAKIEDGKLRWSVNLVPPSVIGGQFRRSYAYVFGFIHGARYKEERKVYPMSPWTEFSIRARGLGELSNASISVVFNGEGKTRQEREIDRVQVNLSADWETYTFKLHNHKERFIETVALVVEGDEADTTETTGVIEVDFIDLH